MSDLVRVIRVLEYTGPREKVEDALSRRHIKGTFIVPGSVTIREALLGEYAEVLPTHSAEHTS